MTFLNDHITIQKRREQNEKQTKKLLQEKYIAIITKWRNSNEWTMLLARPVFHANQMITCLIIDCYLRATYEIVNAICSKCSRLSLNFCLARAFFCLVCARAPKRVSQFTLSVSSWCGRIQSEQNYITYFCALTSISGDMIVVAEFQRATAQSLIAIVTWFVCCLLFLNFNHKMMIGPPFSSQHASRIRLTCSMTAYQTDTKRMQSVSGWRGRFIICF